jgi:hypothetical protein
MRVHPRRRRLDPGDRHAAARGQGLATIPEGLWELCLGVYCTVWGFRRDAPILTGETAETAPAGAPLLAGSA